MTLERTIADHRALYASDLSISRLVQRQPPTSLDLNTGVLHQEPAAAIGMTVSGQLLRYVSHPEGYGSSFPWSRALWRLRAECRRIHPYHRHAERPYWRGSLCWQFVHLTVCRSFSVENAAKILRYDNPEPVLRFAFGFIEASIDDARRRAERRAREDEGHGPGAVPRPVAEHHVPSEEHIRECPNPACRARRTAA